MMKHTLKYIWGLVFSILMFPLTLVAGILLLVSAIPTVIGWIIMVLVSNLYTSPLAPKVVNGEKYLSNPLSWYAVWLSDIYAGRWP